MTREELVERAWSLIKTLDSGDLCVDIVYLTHNTLELTVLASEDRAFNSSTIVIVLDKDNSWGHIDSVGFSSKELGFSTIYANELNAITGGRFDKFKPSDRLLHKLDIPSKKKGAT